MATRKQESKVVLTAEDKTRKAFQDAGKQADGLAKRYGGVGIASATLGGGLVATAAAVVAMTTRSIEQATALQRQADMAGVNVVAFQELEHAAGTFGATQEAVTDGLKELALRGDEFAKTGGGSAAEAFERLGFSQAEVAEQLRDTPALLEDVAGRMEELGTAAQIRISDELFGGQGGEQFNKFLASGATNIAALRSEAHELGIVLDDSMVAAAERANITLDQTAKIIGVNLQKVFLAFSPLVESMGRAFGEAAPQIAAAAESLVAFFGGAELLSLAGLQNQLAALNTEWAQLNDEQERFGEQSIKEGGVRHAEKIAELEEQITKIAELMAIRLESAEQIKQLAAAQRTAAEETRSSEEGDKARAVLESITMAHLQAFDAQEQIAEMQRDQRLARLDELKLTDEELRTAQLETEAIFQVQLAEVQKTGQEAIEEQAADHLLRISDQQALAAEINKQLWESGLQGQLQVTSNVLGQVSTLMESKNKTMFKIGKAAAISKTVIDTLTAAQGAYAALASIPYVGPVLGAAAAAAALVAGYARVKKIKSQQFGGGDSGGGGGGGGGSTPAVSGAPALPSLDQIQTQQQAAPPRVITLILDGDDFYSADNFRNRIIPAINDQIGDGVVLEVRQ